MQNNKKIGILGIGNLLMRDEGFGVHFIEHFEKRFSIPKNITILDGGTAGIMLAPFIEDADILYVIDTVAIKDEPGSIHCFSDEDVRSGSIQMRMSPHQVGLLDILSLCRLRDRAPEKTKMITVVPDELELSIGLSPCLQAKLAEVTSILVRSLAEYGVSLLPRKPVTSA